MICSTTTFIFSCEGAYLEVEISKLLVVPKVYVACEDNIGRKSEVPFVAMSV